MIQQNPELHNVRTPIVQHVVYLLPNQNWVTALHFQKHSKKHMTL